MQSPRFITAIVLSLGVLLAWNMMFPQYNLNSRRSIPQPQSVENITQTNTAIQPVTTTLNQTNTRNITIPITIPITTPVIDGTIASGNAITSVSLKQYPANPSDKSNKSYIQIISKDRGYYVDFGWINIGGTSDTQAVELPSSATAWSSNGTHLSKDSPIIFSWQNTQNIIFAIKISIVDDYLFNVNLSVQNNSGRNISLSPYARIVHTIDSKSQNLTGTSLISHEGFVGYSSGTFKEISYKDVYKKSGKVPVNGLLLDGFGRQTNTWFGVSGKYWLTAIIPMRTTGVSDAIKTTNIKSTDVSTDIVPNPIDVHFSLASGDYKNGVFQADYSLSSVASSAITSVPIGQSEPDSSTQSNGISTSTVKAGQLVSYDSLVYIGPKKLEILDKYSRKYQIPLFDRVIDFGFLYFITKPIFILLVFLDKICGNVGVGIIILTLIIKALLFPFSIKSMISMAKMRKLSPKVVELREMHRGNKLAMNQSIAALYRENNVNPLSGCLSIIIQMPIFFALYKVLFVTIEMRGADFIWWMKDLSLRETVGVFNLFGLLPFNVPIGLQIGPLALMMGFTMWLQQRMNPKNTGDSFSTTMMSLIPVIFTIIFSTFPAGLLLYWVTNNILSITQQFVVEKLFISEINKTDALQKLSTEKPTKWKRGKWRFLDNNK